MSVPVGGQIPAQICNEKRYFITQLLQEKCYQEENVISFTDDLYKQQISLSLHLRSSYGIYTIDPTRSVWASREKLRILDAFVKDH